MREGLCSLRLTRRYSASPTEVWRALTSPDSVARWLGPLEQLDLRPNGAIRLELADKTKLEGRVREIDPGHVLEIDWRTPGEGTSVVRFRLTPDGAGTLLVLDHERIEERLGMRYMGRWGAAVGRLARLMDR